MRSAFTEPVDLYRAARHLGRRPALLESLGPAVPYGRLSLLGTRCVRTLEVWDGALFVDGRREGEALEVLERLAEGLGGREQTFPAWIGFFAYEFAGRLGLPAAQPVASAAADYAKAQKYPWPDTGSVSTSVPTNTNFLVISYSAPDPQQAREWAEAYSQGYMKYRQGQALDLYKGSQASLAGQIQQIEEQISTAQVNANAATSPEERAQYEAQVKALTSSLKDILNQGGNPIPYPTDGSTAQEIAQASFPTAPYSPSWPKNIALALAAGLALGFAVVFTRERLDDRLAGREDLEELLGAPVLAIVPKISGWKKKNKTN
jgi:capsular polysaccharide biosynthesis protein